MRLATFARLSLVFASLSLAACGGGTGAGGVPDAPAQVMLTPTSGGAQLIVDWTDVAGATSYNVYVARFPGVDPLNYGINPDGTHVPGVAGGPILLSGLTDGITYFVVVAASNGAGEGPISREARVLLIPAAPAGPLAIARGGTMTITATPVEGAAAYDFSIANSDQVTSANWAGLPGGQQVTTFGSQVVVPDVENGVPYSIVVRARNASGASRDSTRVSVTPNGRGTFVDFTTIAAGASPQGSITAFLNGDGLPDLAVADVASDSVNVFLGVGDGTFVPAGPAVAVGAAPLSLISADVNADLKADLVTANSGDGTVSVLLGDGLGGFGARQDFPAGVSPASLTAISMDGLLDSTLDLVVTDSAADSVAVLLGLGDGTFGAPTPFATGAGPSFLRSFDVNGDGYLDVITANTTGDSVTTLFGDGSGGFPLAVDSPTPPGPSSFDFGDFQGDGEVDLAVTSSVDGSVSILAGNGNGAFGGGATVPTGASPGSVAVGDFDGDGFTDIAVANAGDGTVTVLLGNGFGQFTKLTDVAAGAGALSLVLADFDGDGILDLAVSNPADGTIRILIGSKS